MAFLEKILHPHHHDNDFETIRPKLVELTNEGLGSVFVRLAFHDAGSFHKDLGKGGGASVRFLLDVSQNAGLSKVIQILEEIKPENMSHADLYQFAAVVAIETLGGPRISFRGGRRDYTEEEAQEILKFHEDNNIDILPKPNREERLRDVFAKYGFGDEEIVIITGAHTIGAAMVPHDLDPRPGKQTEEVEEIKQNPRKAWSRTPKVFDNDYFIQLYKEQWGSVVVFLSGDQGKKVWFDSSTKSLMLFETDFILKTDPVLRKLGKKYKADNELFKTDFARVFKNLGKLGHADTLGHRVQ